MACHPGLHHERVLVDQTKLRCYAEPDGPVLIVDSLIATDAAGIASTPSDRQEHSRHMLERSDMMKFDRVELHQVDGQVRVLTPEEFRALPAVDRVQWIGQGRFRFSLAGQKIRPIDAIKVDRKTA